MAFVTAPPQPSCAILSFPTPEILLVVLNRPKAMNSLPSHGSVELNDVWEWMDAEPSLRIGIITGKGRAFSAGADLKEWNNTNSSKNAKPRGIHPSGFAGISRRTGKKPIICAVNGIAFGGGCELIVNADMVIASKRGARFALTEVKRGVVALAGSLPRLVRTIGKPRAMEMALTGRVILPAEAERWGLINEVVEDEDEAESDGSEEGLGLVMKRKVVQRAVQLAQEITANSPDAVIVTREGIKMGWEGVGADEATSLTLKQWSKKLNEGENLKEGVRAFVEKRKPRWVPSKL
ncbi:hypothetical protein FQN57_002984 [Myotisia sp. PD_48]|nr:hypothetical protein FQN57_002984 [Myotisia sp. PD_48]